MSSSNDPLWIKVRNAWLDANFSDEAAAAVLRVFADEVVPEEPTPFHLLELEDDTERNWRTGSWERSQQIRKRLLAEAERAEAGR